MIPDIIIYVVLSSIIFAFVIPIAFVFGLMTLYEFGFNILKTILLILFCMICPKYFKNFNIEKSLTTMIDYEDAKNDLLFRLNGALSIITIYLAYYAFNEAQSILLCILIFTALFFRIIIYWNEILDKK